MNGIFAFRQLGATGGQPFFEKVFGPAIFAGI
jgi:hypothetical protein